MGKRRRGGALSSKGSPLQGTACQRRCFKVICSPFFSQSLSFPASAKVCRRRDQKSLLRGAGGGLKPETKWRDSFV